MTKTLTTYLGILCLLLSSFSLTAQIPCNNGMVIMGNGVTIDTFPCSNVDLQAYVSLAGTELNSTGTNDVWGWTSPNGSEYAIVGLQDGVSFVNVTTPTSPVVYGKLQRHSGQSSSVQGDVKVIGNFAYIGSEAGNSGIQIFDLMRLDTSTYLPKSFVENGWIHLGSTSNRSHNLVASLETGYIIPVGAAGVNNRGLSFYDTNTNPDPNDNTSPTNPTLRGGFASAGPTHDAVCFIYRGLDSEHIGKEICIGLNEDHIAITDITDKSNPSAISSFSYSEVEYCHQGWITDDHKYLLVNDEFDELAPLHQTRTYIFDISDLNTPSLKYTYTADSFSIDHNLYVKGPYAYLSNYTSGLRILDISDLDNNPPVEVAYFDNYPDDDDGSFDGAWSAYPYFKSGTIVMTNIDGDHGGLYVVTPNLSHYVLEVLGSGISTACQGESTSFFFDATSYSGGGTADNITFSNLPNGVTASFNASSNSMSVNTSANTPVGKYNIMLTGNTIPKNRVSVGLEVTSPAATLDATTLESPTNGADEQPVNLTFNWNPTNGATSYDIEISTSSNFNSIDFSAYGLSTTTYEQTGLDTENSYFWRVNSRNDNCEVSSPSSVFQFKTNSNPLPVELVSFKATANVKDILLDWETASETGFAGFELQRSTVNNATDFKKISWIPTSQAAVDSGLKNYRFVDTDVIEGQLYYYRLRQVDVDGSFEFSLIVSAQLTTKEGVLQLFPNPAEKEITLLLDRTLSNALVSLSIYDIAGKLVRQKDISSDDLTNGYLLNISNLEKGAYLLSLANEEIKETVRFVKQ